MLADVVGWDQVSVELVELVEWVGLALRTWRRWVVVGWVAVGWGKSWDVVGGGKGVVVGIGAVVRRVLEVPCLA